MWNSQQGGEGLPCSFWKPKKVTWFWKKDLNCVHLVSKSSKIFACGAFFFFCLWQEVYWSVLIQQNFPYPENFLVALLVTVVYSGIFWPIRGHSAIFNHVQVYWGTLRHIEAYLGIIDTYRVIIKNTLNSM